MDNVLNFVKIPDEINYWFVRASRGARYYKDFMVNNFIAVASIVDLNFIKKINVVGLTKKDALTIFKNKFNKYAKDTIEDYEPYRNATTDTAKEKAKSKRLSRSTTLSKVNYSFVNEMKVGDVVIVPGKSAKNFLIGIVLSDCFDTDIKHEFIPNKKKEQSYDECYFTLKRGVYWIKEISFNEFPDKMNAITNAHQSVLNILNYADSINPLISSNFIYQKNYFTRINVKTVQDISSDDLYYFQKLLHIVNESVGIELKQKTKIQSPGDIILFIQNNWQGISIVLGLLFGEIKFGKIKITNLATSIQSFIHKGKENKIHESIEYEKLKQEKIKTEILEDIQKKFKDDLPHIKKLNLNNDSIGTEFVPEKQKENLNTYRDLCEKTKQQDKKREENDETEE
ncbi:hypothetical protein [Ligilactobacillus aviarius]|uniref:hypothetical protein n=1 Tax=Ligilactobacillus aviarius TaxID=1606 RepID=UPI0024B8811D|nr:hypothetical protein [Ligilactobacillus aviarius]